MPLPHRKTAFGQAERNKFSAGAFTINNDGEFVISSSSSFHFLFGGHYSVGFLIGGFVCIVVDIFASNWLDDLIDNIAK